MTLEDLSKEELIALIHQKDAIIGRQILENQRMLETINKQMDAMEHQQKNLIILDQQIKSIFFANRLN